MTTPIFIPISAFSQAASAAQPQAGQLRLLPVYGPPSAAGQPQQQSQLHPVYGYPQSGATGGVPSGAPQPQSFPGLSAAASSASPTMQIIDGMAGQVMAQGAQPQQAPMGLTGGSLAQPSMPQQQQNPQALQQLLMSLIPLLMGLIQQLSGGGAMPGGSLLGGAMPGTAGASPLMGQQDPLGQKVSEITGQCFSSGMQYVPASLGGSKGLGTGSLQSAVGGDLAGLGAISSAAAGCNFIDPQTQALLMQTSQQTGALFQGIA